MIHHIEIYVSDLKKSAEFWGWLLGKLNYTEHPNWEHNIVNYKLNNSYIVFVQTEREHLDVTYHRKKTGLNHLAFHVESREEVDTLTKQLEAKGVTILYTDKHPYAGGKNYYAVFFEDPDRIKVELVAPN